MPGTELTALLDWDSVLSEDERLIQQTVHDFVGKQVKPHIAQWFEEGVSPKELAEELGSLGLLGMHLEGYGCAGTNAVSYGLACLELEAGDSGLRSFVSVQGSLSMFSIWRYGSPEQKLQWLPRLASGVAIGCFGLTEPDFGSDPAGMRTRAVRDRGDWILNGSKMWITNGSIADVATVWARTDEGIRGFLVPRGTARSISLRSARRSPGSRPTAECEQPSWRRVGRRIPQAAGGQRLAQPSRRCIRAMAASAAV